MYQIYFPMLVFSAAFFWLSSAFIPPTQHISRRLLSATTTGVTNAPRSLEDSSNTRTSPPAPIPITLLSGFLGAGKTCALQHFLDNQEGLKIGVIVNDMASVNIDAKLVAKQAGDMLELQNGCVCCSLSSELVFAVEKLISGGRELDAIVVELSGVSDPKAIQSFWSTELMDGVPASIEHIVTLVDSTTFGTDYMTWDLVSEREGWVAASDSCTGNLKISELLAEQVEAANVIVINKVDVSESEQVIVATKVAKALNEKATIVQAKFGQIPARLVLKTKQPSILDPYHHDHSHNHRQNHSSNIACTDPDCAKDHHTQHNDHGTHSHSHSHQHQTTDDLGIKSFVYTATRPFIIDRLMKLLNQWPVPIKDVLDASMLADGDLTEYEDSDYTPFTGVIRSKGYCWFAPRKWTGSNADAWRHDTAMYWSNAGRQMGISSAGKWWASIPDNKMKAYLAKIPAEYKRIKSEDFKTQEFGDRRQEIVFIGTDLRVNEITVELNSCLASARELDSYRQQLENFKNSQYSSVGLFDTMSTDHLNT